MDTAPRVHKPEDHKSKSRPVPVWLVMYAVSMAIAVVIVGTVLSGVAGRRVSVPRPERMGGACRTPSSSR